MRCAMRDVLFIAISQAPPQVPSDSRGLLRGVSLARPHAMPQQARGHQKEKLNRPPRRPFRCRGCRGLPQGIFWHMALPWCPTKKKRSTSEKTLDEQLYGVPPGPRPTYWPTATATHPPQPPGAARPRLRRHGRGHAHRLWLPGGGERGCLRPHQVAGGDLGTGPGGAVRH